jgi:hypothetical protein
VSGYTTDRYRKAAGPAEAITVLAAYVKEIAEDPGRLPTGRAEGLLGMVPELRDIYRLAAGEARSGTDAPTWPDKLGEWGRRAAGYAQIVLPEVRDLIVVWDHRV